MASNVWNSETHVVGSKPQQIDTLVIYADFRDAKIRFNEPKFVNTYRDHIKSPWKLFDPMMNVHQVSFYEMNGDAFLGYGWSSMTEFYKIKEGVFIKLLFLGNSNFLFKIYDVEGKKWQYPKREEQVSFPVVLTKSMVTGSQLKIPNGMWNDIFAEANENWKLRGPYEVDMEVKILYNLQYNTFKFGSGWKLFSQKNELKEGDTISFVRSPFKIRTYFVQINS